MDSLKQENRANEVIEDFNRQAGHRYNEESHWREIAERFIPNHREAFNNSTTHAAELTKGNKRMEYIFDSAPITALGRFAAICDSLLTPQNTVYQRISADNSDLAKIRRVKLYFEDTTNILFKFRYASKANFKSQNNQIFQGLGAFGSSSMFTDDADSGRGFRYKACHLSEIFFVENHQGIVDKVFRHFPLTARQAVQKFGENCPKEIQDIEKKDPMKYFFFIHRVQPNTDRDPQRLDAKGMMYESIYVCKEHKCVVQEGGYNTLPYQASRYNKAPGETYGRSPAMEALPSNKTLQEMKKTYLKVGHRISDPVLLLHDDGVLDNVDLTPGSQNWGGVDANGRPLVQTLPTGNYNVSKDMMDSEKSAINDAFLISLFQILTENPQMTATEVIERTREKGILMNPTFGLIQSEYLDPLAERELDILSRQGLLPEMPPELLEAEGEYKITYDSPMSRALKSEETSAIFRALEWAMGMATTTGDPAWLDPFDAEAIVPEVSYNLGVPTRYMRSLEKLQSMRAARAETAQAQEDIQRAPGEAALLKAAKAEDNS